MTYEAFLAAVGGRQIPASVATETLTEIKNIELDCELIILTFDTKNDARIYTVNVDGSVEVCDNFAAIGSGSLIAEGVLFQREHESTMPLGPTIYHVFEAMKLGSIASDVGKEHTIDVLYPPNPRAKKTVMADYLNDKGKLTMEKMFRKYGPKSFVRLGLPKGVLEPEAF